MSFKQVLLSIAIAIVFVFFVGFGIDTFYQSPEYKDFCEDESFRKPYPIDLRESSNCTYVEPSQELTKECTAKEGNLVPDRDKQGCVEGYYCEICDKEYKDVNEVYNRNVFLIAVGIGIIVLIIGFALKIPSVSSGLMAGGILSILYGTIRYWGDLPDYGRFIILGLTLAILIWLGYKKLKN
jgi:hypothetical protein